MAESSPRTPYHIWCVPTDKIGVLRVQWSEYDKMPDGALKLHVSSSKEAERLVVDSCLLVATKGQKAPIYLFDGTCAHNDMLAVTLLAQRLRQAYERRGLSSTDENNTR